MSFCNNLKSFEKRHRELKVIWEKRKNIVWLEWRGSKRIEKYGKLISKRGIVIFLSSLSPMLMLVSYIFTSTQDSEAFLFLRFHRKSLIISGNCLKNISFNLHEKLVFSNLGRVGPPHNMRTLSLTISCLWVMMITILKAITCSWLENCKVILILEEGIRL